MYAKTCQNAIEKETRNEVRMHSNFVVQFCLDFFLQVHTYLFSNYCFIQKAHNNHSKSLLLLGRCIFFLFIFFQKEISNLVKICEPSDSLDIYQPVEKKSCKKLNHKYGFTIGLVYIIQTLFLLLHIQRKVNDFVASSCELSTFLFFLLNRR